MGRSKIRVTDVIRKYEYPSKSNPSNPPYVCVLFKSGRTACNCPGWTRRTQETGEPWQEVGIELGHRAWNGKLFRSCRHTADAHAASQMIADKSAEVGFELDI